ncbi:hypothetical protein GDO81_008814 [Engystomops pustulosus]|uniref:Usherin n=1 Tax=Engystomops pustulosus TaxID=76066 RepID=A0AAV7CI39_ENGPU|nr:hypothetical protein GDO81_008814 [Engystomops pustulosus]
MVEAQGLFPELENIALYKPIYTDPPNATCGIPKRSVFCQSDVNFQSIQTCTQRLCIQDCPYRAASPGFQQLLTGDLGPCVRQDKVNLRPRSGNYSNSFIFYDHKDCVVTASPLRFGSSFTLAVWLKPEQDGEMCVIEKSADGQIVFRLTISETESAFYYRTVNGLQPPIKVMTRGRFPARQWIHLAVQVSSDQFIGWMQDFRLYQEAITNREILEVFSEKFLQVPIQSDCRCPGSHPRLHLPDGRSCLPNGVSNTTKDRVLRLNRDAHPVSYMNDNDLQTAWVSSILSTSDFDAGLNITVDLSNGQYQIFYVTIQFYSPMPKALKIQRQKNRNSLWEDWQYFASDCQNFGMENNGFLETPSSVNCLQFPRETPYSDGNVTLSLLTPEPNHRPGYNDFYKNQDLQEFVKASLVRIQFIGQYHTLESNGSFRHRYYGIREITISGRCNCHGHANSCDTSVSPYKCLCDTESFTDGDKCDRCAPLYNDKPFRQGDHVHAYGCVPCRCHNHSSSCHYDASVDPHPDDHHRGGGGVCDDCSHNTAGNYTSVLQLGGQCRCKVNVGGRRCDQCKDGYYNLQESNPDGCQPCHCNTSGTINGSHDCHRNTGQCQCKAHVTGPRCDGCRLGFRGDASGAQRCIQCTCSPYGAINHFCNPSSGQCKCRENVGGADCDTCIDNYYGLDADGCKPCECHTEGIIPGTVCDAVTGQCVCQRNVGGRRCDECSEGYYKSTQNGSTSCLPCRCDRSGAVNGSQSCDQSTGQCVCKASVTGRRCSTCSDHTYNLSSENSRGCQDCNCDPNGTVQGSTCDPVHGQCQCLPNYQGRRCAQCKPGFHISSDRSSLGCVPCDCHPRGSTNATCDDMTGQCYCQDSSLTGLKCDQCRETFFGFDSDTGRCQPCSCHPAGAVTTSCHAVTGQCLCKELVSGRSCSHCAEGSSSLDGRNPYGCSSSPSQQPPPRGHVVNSTTIILTWSPPDSPNTNRIDYVLSRDGLGIYESTDFYPYGVVIRHELYMRGVHQTLERRVFHASGWLNPQPVVESENENALTPPVTHAAITNLEPNTEYEFCIVTSNMAGSIASEWCSALTDPVYMPPPSVIPLSSDSLNVTWEKPGNNFARGEVTGYTINMVLYVAESHEVYYEVTGLEAYQDYIFTVTLCNKIGCVTSKHSSGRTLASAPQEIKPPQVEGIDSTVMKITWSAPLKLNGPSPLYQLERIEPSLTIQDQTSFIKGVRCPGHGYVRFPPSSLPGNTYFTGVLTGLVPFTNYAVTLSVCTLSGCSEDSGVLNITTLQEAPGDVLPPSAESYPSSLYLHWSPPKNPNGVISQYMLYMDGVQIHTGKETGYNISALAPFTTHRFLLSACTVVGCTNSSQVTLTTAQLSPEYVAPPVLRVLDSTRIHIQWNEPDIVNGILERYMLHLSENMDNVSLWSTIYNSTELFLDYTLQGLTPGTKYFIKLSVSVITSYGLYMDGILMQNSSRQSYFVDGLSPWSKHSFRLRACTAKGCALGEKIEAYTQESEPEGNVAVHVNINGPKEVQLKWRGPEKPNGRMTYDVIFNGLFYEKEGDEIRSITNSSRILYRSQERDEWVLVDGLVPFSTYTIKVNASNSQGHVTSAPIVITMPPGAPDGVLPPRLSSANPTSLQVVWSSPVRNNAPGLPHYRLQMRSTNPTNKITDEFSGPSASFTYTIKNLQPYTMYELRSIASNVYGDTYSQWINVTTEQDKPGSIDPPRPSHVKSRSITITWKHPTKANGIITHYNIYQNGSPEVTVPGNRTSHSFHNLTPYTSYLYQLEGCTSAGCSLSKESLVMETLPDAPSGVLPPDLYSDSPTSVIIRWKLPLHPHGVIESFSIERRLIGTELIDIIATVPGSHPMEYIDQASDINPWKMYEYRMVVSTFNGGTNYSDWVEVTTRPSRPVGVQPPEVTILGPYTAKVTWRPPLRPNGDIISYEIRMPDPRILLTDPALMSYIMTGLIPYSNYSVTLVVCSGGGSYHGGCTESPPTHVTTHSAPPEGVRPLSVIPVSETFIAVSWQPPLRPNGPDIRYELLRRTILQPLTSNPPEDLNLWQNIYSGTQWFCEDKGLSRYTFYEYKLIVYNSVGYTSSPEVVGKTLPGPPIRGSHLTVKPVNHTAIEASWTRPCKSVEVRWSPPEEPNGIILGYELRRRHERPCNSRRKLSLEEKGPFCFFIKCKKGEDICGGQCYDPLQQVCCHDVLHGRQDGYECCAQDYIASIDNTSRICCGGQVHVVKPDHRCCGGYYVKLHAGEVCCYNKTENRVSIGDGDSCCGDKPYSMDGTQICCGGSLWDGFAQRCCGGRITPPGFICCGDEQEGSMYRESLGLQPYTKYLFSLTACTSVGCNSSDVASGCTSQAPPQGIWQDPRHVTINSSALELYWREPEKPNGMISEYRLIRDGAVISTRSGDGLDFTDVGLQPNSSYFYQLEARNEAGSNISNVYVVDTPPETPRKIPVPYNITVLGPYSAFLAWDYPGVYDPSIALDFNVLLNAGRSDAQMQPAGENRFIILEDLVPGAQYSLRVQACQLGSCGVGGSAYMVTAEAAPEDLDPPTLFAVGPHAITITWKAPKRPNGFITQYIIYRCLAGGHENKTSFPLSGGVLEYTDISEDLRPHTHYKYSITAQNSAGYLESSWSIVRTGEASPEGLDPPTAEAASAYSVRLTWTPPRRPHGIITQYIIMYQEIPRGSAPETFFGSTITVSGTSYQATVFGLHPFTTYNISIKASNSAGTVSSTWTSIKTWEAAPSGLNFTVDKTENGRALLLRWSHPERTNGALTMFNVYSDGNLEYSGLSQQFLLRRLESFTVYTLVLEACTAAGCTQTFPHRVQTDEASPVSQLPPQIKALNATHILLSWSPPVQPNGKIIQYDIMKRSGQETSATNRRNMAENLVFKELNTEPMVFTYTDGGLKPWTDYEYKIRAWNSVGYTDSEWTVGQTSQAAPTFILPPKLLYDTQNPNHITIHWTKPEEDNGKILYYKLQKNNITLPFNFDFATLNYTDEDLLPYSEYTYSIEACTVGGCTISDRTHIRTLEGPPDGLNPPRAEALGATEVNVTWSPPSILNGEITKYMVKIDNETYFAGTRLSMVISNLQPFMMYNVSLVACTNGGCASSSSTLVKTKEDRPLYMKEPSFLVTSAQSIKISWQGPEKPNGEIKNYTLHRDGQLIYTGLDTHYHDYGLEPGTEYTYTIQASNIQGSCTSSPASIKTQPSSPSGMETPKLLAKSPYEMLVSWRAPLKSNGPIHNYTLHIHHPVEMKDVQYTFNNSLQNDHSYVIKDLKPYTQYEARVEACTPLGCAVSEWMTSHTLEAPPESQPAPLIDVQKNTKAPLLAWNGPHQPNGKIIRYDVYRRRIYDPQEMLTAELVFNGSSLSFQDVDLLPYTEYEYQSSTNGQLKEFVLTERGHRMYSGLDSSVHIQKTTDKTPEQSNPSTKNGMETKASAIYTELWFILVMALLALLLLAILLSLILQKKLTKNPYPRERPPLVPLQQRMSPGSAYSESDTYTGMSDIKISGVETHSSHNTMVVRKTSQSQISHSFSQNSLYRSASQLIASHDKKSIVDSSIWDSAIQGHDSGMFMDDEDLTSTIKSFSTVTKQHTAFTDTPL